VSKGKQGKWEFPKINELAAFLVFNLFFELPLLWCSSVVGYCSGADDGDSEQHDQDAEGRRRGGRRVEREERRVSRRSASARMVKCCINSKVHAFAFSG
jgi:hypothetical protein